MTKRVFEGTYASDISNEIETWLEKEMGEEYISRDTFIVVEIIQN